MDIRFKDTVLADLYDGKPIIDKRFKANPLLARKCVRTIDKLKHTARIEDLFRLKSLGCKKQGSQLFVWIDTVYQFILDEVADTGACKVISLAFDEITIPKPVLSFPKLIISNDQHTKSHAWQADSSGRNTGR